MQIKTRLFTSSNQIQLQNLGLTLNAVACHQVLGKELFFILGPAYPSWWVVAQPDKKHASRTALSCVGVVRPIQTNLAMQL